VTVLGLDFGHYHGSILTETIFSWLGIGVAVNAIAVSRRSPSSCSSPSSSAVISSLI
jgi:ABC-type dipeptide/oligopeptide/nickel transport system permease component